MGNKRIDNADRDFATKYQDASANMASQSRVFRDRALCGQMVGVNEAQAIVCQIYSAVAAERAFQYLQAYLARRFPAYSTIRMQIDSETQLTFTK